MVLRISAEYSNTKLVKWKIMIVASTVIPSSRSSIAKGTIGKIFLTTNEIKSASVIYAVNLRNYCLDFCWLHFSYLCVYTCISISVVILVFVFMFLLVIIMNSTIYWTIFNVCFERSVFFRNKNSMHQHRIVLKSIPKKFYKL